VSWRPIGGPARSGECGIRGRSGPDGAVDQRFAPGGSACHGMVSPTSMVAVTTGGRVGWGTWASTSQGRLPVQYAVSKAHKQSRAAGQT